ncbi:MAG TPA: aminoacetone oxidase family FAD-binding enzyme [Desulfotomaculum sp.]|nr:MAG: HI0933 family protein [Desulfotomaculum sp. 46_80]HAG10449.1 aminoacetone oxidase family FAD-binding enzyme [Desulfotomaculum sp.]HBY05136.1 aminoacetone oxidase family FAD-binding enzyme [Desulfotomaculum sp.]
MYYDLITVGGGPAGMMGAAAAAQRGLKVVLLEKNDRLGKKLSITGNGRCNFTNLCDPASFMDNIVNNGRFLHASLNRFNNHSLVSFFNSLGVKTKVEDDNRVFPASDRAEEIIKALHNYLHKSKVEIRFNSAVKKVLAVNNRVTGVITDNNKVAGENVLIATGGLSYRQTGSAGDGFRMARTLGHFIAPPRPALVPLVAGGKWVKQLQGLSLQNINVQAVNVQAVLEEKVIAEQTGELIFTHFGVSGPVILKLSSLINKCPPSSLALRIDLFSSISTTQLNAQLIEIFKKNHGKYLKNALGDFVPQKMLPLLQVFAGIDILKQVDQITKEEREKLANSLKRIALTIKGARPLNEAMVTAGGIDTNEINPSSMESKIVRGLFFAGEVIDVDALTGGFNLQIAFSTGYLSGVSVKSEHEHVGS